MATVTASTMDKLESILGDQAKDLLEHSCKTVSRDLLHLPGPDFVSRVWSGSDRPVQVLRSLEAIYDHGRLGGTGLITGRKAFQRPFEEGVGLLNAVQDVYLNPGVTIA